MGKNKLGIVILNYITWSETERCIMSIRDTLKTKSYKIYLIDNASPVLPDLDIKLFLQSAADIVCVFSDKNCGYAAGNNIGILKALADGCSHILVTNNDIVFQNSCIEEMIEAFEVYDGVGIIGPLVINDGGSIQKNTNFKEEGLKQKYIAETIIRKIYPKYRIQCFGNDQDYHKISFVYSVSGCCFMLSKICANKITPFDENTFLYGEESIIGNRMKNTGYKTLYYPKVSVIHKHGSSTKHVKSFSYICRVNSELYYCKQYLEANIISILPLYFIRSLSYLIKSMYIKEYRHNLRTYFENTIKYLMRAKVNEYK